MAQVAGDVGPDRRVMHPALAEAARGASGGGVVQKLKPVPGMWMAEMAGDYLYATLCDGANPTEPHPH